MSATDDKRAIAAAETAAKAAVSTAAHGRSRPRRRRKRRAGREHGIDVADDDGATIALPPTTTVRSTRRWWRSHRDPHPSIGIHCAHNAPGCHSTVPTLLRHRVRGGLSGAGWGHVELAGHFTIKKLNAAPTNGDLSRFPCGLS